MSLLVEVITLLAAIAILYILWKSLEFISYLIVNSIMGIIIFWVLSTYFMVDVPINILSIGVVAIAGIPGVILVLVIHFLGLGF